MKNPNYKGIELLPLSVIKAARAGDAEAVERVLRYYEGYINKLCTFHRHDTVTNRPPRRLKQLNPFPVSSLCGGPLAAP